ncbi:hypothetical protein J2S78_000903 [Salibacterium salarium]|uniref:hypothetical protein n=1 Tax=Salibacterium salarium TaxID=284579 RepID=UPI0027867C6F|nr:hypothetical protein [Salibacterium salarium]MDQ0298495.1 hypothetical protein [Salibacterium salarium]
MNKRLREWIDFTHSSIGLGNYYLYTYHLHKSVNLINETVYILSMEWFPTHVTGREEDGLNPKGTAAIDIDISNGQFKSIVFVGGQSFAKNGIRFAQRNNQDVIQWLEKEIGITYEEQFHLVKEEERGYRFAASIHGIEVAPDGFIEIRFDDEGNLTFYSVDGYFPTKEEVEEEPFLLTFDAVKSLAKQQLKLIEFPSHELERLIPVYGIEEIYVSNDGLFTIPFGTLLEEISHVSINKIMNWDTSMENPFERSKLDFNEEVTEEEALSGEPHPDSFPITTREQSQCITAVETFMRQEFPDETGNWILKTLHRDHSYIIATIKHNSPSHLVFQRKLKVVLDREQWIVLNYMDNAFLIEMYQNFAKPDTRTIDKEEAFEKIKTEIIISPVYVYDVEQQKYILCGKIDSSYGVHAGNGDVLLLDDI